MAYEGAAYISFDPGKTTGVTTWDEEGNVKALHEFNEEQLDEFLDLVEAWSIKPNEFIIEEYRVYRSVNHTGSKVYTIQVIGSIKRTARRLKIKLKELRADCKRISALWSGTKWDFSKKTHMPNYLAAFLIGYYHLHNIGVIKPRVLDD